MKTALAVSFGSGQLDSCKNIYPTNSSKNIWPGMYDYLQHYSFLYTLDVYGALGDGGVLNNVTSAYLHEQDLC